MVVATDDNDIAILDDKTKEQLEKLPGKYWKIGIDGNTATLAFAKQPAWPRLTSSSMHITRRRRARKAGTSPNRWTLRIGGNSTPRPSQHTHFTVLNQCARSCA